MWSTRHVGYESTVGTKARRAREHVGQEAHRARQHVGYEAQGHVGHKSTWGTSHAGHESTWGTRACRALNLADSETQENGSQKK